MENLYRIAGILCVTGYISGLMLNFVSTTQTRKAIRLVTALYIISVAFTGWDNITFRNMVPVEDVIIRQHTDENYMLSAAQEKICDDIKYILSSENIDYTDISVHINKETEKVELSHITIYGADEQKHGEILLALSDIYTKDKIKFEA